MRWRGSHLSPSASQLGNTSQKRGRGRERKHLLKAALVLGRRAYQAVHRGGRPGLQHFWGGSMMGTQARPPGRCWVVSVRLEAVLPGAWGCPPRATTRGPVVCPAV